MRPAPAARSRASISAGRCGRRSRRAIAIKGGGHAMAAGVTLATERLGDWRAFLEERLGQAVTKARAEAGLKVDAALTATAATPELVHRLEAAGPYGAGAPEPLFALAAPSSGRGDAGRGRRGATCACARSRRRTGGRGRSPSAPRARSSARRSSASRARRSISPGRSSVNRYGGRERAQIRVVDVAEASAVIAR